MALFNNQTIRTNWPRAQPGTPSVHRQRENLPIEVKFSRRVVEDADPYNTNSIRRAEASDQSSEPNGVIQPPGPQNELSAATRRRAVKIRTKCVEFCILFLLNSIPHKTLVFYKKLC